MTFHGCLSRRLTQGRNKTSLRALLTRNENTRFKTKGLSVNLGLKVEESWTLERLCCKSDTSYLFPFIHGYPFCPTSPFFFFFYIFQAGQRVSHWAPIRLLCCCRGNDLTDIPGNVSLRHLSNPRASVWTSWVRRGKPVALMLHLSDFNMQCHFVFSKSRVNIAKLAAAKCPGGIDAMMKVTLAATKQNLQEVPSKKIHKQKENNVFSPSFEQSQ